MPNKYSKPFSLLKYRLVIAQFMRRKEKEWFQSFLVFLPLVRDRRLPISRHAYFKTLLLFDKRYESKIICANLIFPANSTTKAFYVEVVDL